MVRLRTRSGAWHATSSCTGTSRRLTPTRSTVRSSPVCSPRSAPSTSRTSPRGAPRTAAVESYPDLKADSTFLDLQRAITDVESHIQFARRYYNGAVRALNTRIESFPDLIVARAFTFRLAEYFELDDDAAP